MSWPQDPKKWDKRQAMRGEQITVRCMLEGGHGPWAIIAEHGVDCYQKWHYSTTCDEVAGRRESICARCGHEESFPPGRVLTDWERGRDS